MGLDMYLNRKTSLNTESYVKEDRRHEIKLTMGGKEIDTSKVNMVIEEVGYWRKANHIHKWFVDNVQKGVDDCREYWVSENQLLKLLAVCKEVMSSKSDEVSNTLLPTAHGFFFGNTEYDEYYYRDVEKTIDIIEALLDKGTEGECRLNGDIYYESSW